MFIMFLQFNVIHNDLGLTHLKKSKLSDIKI